MIRLNVESIIPADALEFYVSLWFGVSDIENSLVELHYNVIREKTLSGLQILSAREKKMDEAYCLIAGIDGVGVGSGWVRNLFKTLKIISK